MIPDPFFWFSTDCFCCCSGSIWPMHEFFAIGIPYSKIQLRWYILGCFPPGQLRFSRNPNHKKTLQLPMLLLRVDGIPWLYILGYYSYPLPSERNCGVHEGLGWDPWSPKHVIAAVINPGGDWLTPGPGGNNPTYIHN